MPDSAMAAFNTSVIPHCAGLLWDDMFKQECAKGFFFLSPCLDISENDDFFFCDRPATVHLTSVLVNDLCHDPYNKIPMRIFIIFIADYTICIYTFVLYSF